MAKANSVMEQAVDEQLKSAETLASAVYSSENFNSVLAGVAKLLAAWHTALVKAGFSEEQATLIVAHGKPPFQLA